MQSTGQPHFTERDEGPHPPSEHAQWQESVLLHWYDQRQGIGGWHRVGHEPNNNGGRAALWSFMFDRSGWQYRRCGDLALTGADRIANGFGAGAHLRFAYEDGSAVWTVHEEGLDAKLECRNLYPLVDPFPPGDELAAKRFPHHFEVAGRVTGRVSYKGRSVSVDGYGYRDHSWGQRDWENGMLNHRWFTGTLGAELSFAAITAQASSGKLIRVGYVSRGGRTVLARSVDVVAHMEPDGLTHRGGELRLTLPDDEVVHVRFQARAGVLFQRGTVVMVEMMCDAQGHGLSGYCDAEISSNPRNGKGAPLLALNANTTEGFSAFAPLSFPPPGGGAAS
jgi:hypothetical protein